MDQDEQNEVRPVRFFSFSGTVPAPLIHFGTNLTGLIPGRVDPLGDSRQGGFGPGLWGTSSWTRLAATS